MNRSAEPWVMPCREATPSPDWVASTKACIRACRYRLLYVMLHARIDTTQGLDGEPVVLAVFDLGEEEIGGSAHAVRAMATERFRTASMSVDDVLEFRELTALTDELSDHLHRSGMRTLV